MLPGRSLAGAKIPLIIDIDAISNGIKTMRTAKTLHHRKQFILAVEAA